MRGEFILNLDKSLYRSFSTIEEAEEWGNKYYGKWAEEYKINIFNLEQIIKSSGYRAIEEYCGHDYKNINSILWEERLDNASDLYKLKINTMLISIALAPRIPENIVVYRGVLNSFIRELKIDRKKDFWKRNKGFLSTSLISNFELGHGYEAILRIYLPKGTYGAYVTNVSGRPKEQEILFLPNAYLKLLDSKRIHKEKIGKYPVYNCILDYLESDL